MIDNTYNAMCESFSYHINTYINENKLTNKQFGELVEKSEASIRNWRDGKLLPDMKSILIVSKLLNKPYYIILGTNVNSALKLYDAYINNPDYQKTIDDLLKLNK